MRTFSTPTLATDERMSFALAPALTPEGIDTSPSFFHGFSTQPQVLARGLVTLADITATRYFQYTPTTQRDPVLTAQGDRLRAEVFSACNSVYARLDLLASGFDGGDITFGTTNVDIGSDTRAALSAIGRHELLHLDVGTDGLTASTLDASAVERPVEMPDRWVRALGNAAELHRGLRLAFAADAAATRRFIATLPAVTSAGRSGWLSVVRGDIRVGARKTPGAVHVSGLRRLSAIKRMLAHVTGISVFGPEGDEPGPAVVTFDLPSARLTIGLTDESWRGFSGEGALLLSLSAPTVLDDADLVSAILAFEPVLDTGRLAREAGITESAVRDALAVLAASGRVGWDLHDEAHFHRELPHDPARVEKDNPRLVRARRLVAEGAVRTVGAHEWQVGSDATGYRVRRDAGGFRCACAWYLKHGRGRGPCAHVLAVTVTEETA